MTALAANKIRTSKVDAGPLRHYPVNGGSHIYAGALVMLDAEHYARPAASLASNGGCVGWAEEEVDNTLGADGAKNVRVISGSILLAATSIAQVSVGVKVFAVDDDTIDETNTGGILPIAGVLEKVVSSTSGWVYVGPIQVVAGL